MTNDTEYLNSMFISYLDIFCEIFFFYQITFPYLFNILYYVLLLSSQERFAYNFPLL